MEIAHIVPYKGVSAYTINAKAIELKEDIKIPAAQPTSIDVWEVDLHLHEILDTGRQLSDHEKLMYQIKYFKKCMESAKANRVKKVIFIHGIGKGTLKQEIIHLLNGYDRIHYHDAPFRQYGYGATAVEFF